MKTELDEANYRAMLMATSMYPYAGEPMAEWFEALTHEQRFMARYRVHEVTKVRFDPAAYDNVDDLTEALGKLYEREQAKIAKQLSALLPEDRRVYFMAKCGVVE